MGQPVDSLQHWEAHGLLTHLDQLCVTESHVINIAGLAGCVCCADCLTVLRGCQ